MDLTGCTVENLTPLGYKNEELSEIFAYFFISKITIIRDGLKTFLNSNTYMNIITICILDTFRIVNQLDVKSEIDRMESKSCELNPFPTKIIKSYLPKFLDAFTTICNKSMQLGYFSQKMEYNNVKTLT